ncbi:MAG: hypothetical protein QM533_13590, partial [Cytophagales bacterium]|nr:hypothetical protein [Cytophagales bacterium]
AGGSIGVNTTGNVVNTGNITSTGAVDVVSTNGNVSNSGNVTGTEVNVTSTDGSIANNGTIAGTNSTAVSAANGDIDNSAPGGFIGSVNGTTNVAGGNVTNSGDIAGQTVSVTGTSLTNSGNITGGYVTANLTGNVTNTGTITGNNSVAVTASNINNSGSGVISSDNGTVTVVGCLTGNGSLKGVAPASTDIPPTPLGGLVRSLFLAVTASGSDNVTINQVAAVVFPRLASPIPETFGSGTCSTMSGSGQPTAQKSLDLIVTGEVKTPEDPVPSPHFDR